MPICFVEKSALGCRSEWSGSIAEGKSLSVFTLCRNRQCSDFRGLFPSLLTINMENQVECVIPQEARVIR